MARSRNIKPGFFDNEYLSQLEPYARLLFIGLWTLADREGRLEDRPARIRGQIFPYEDSVDVGKLLDALEKNPDRFISRYEVEGSQYIQINKWHLHQRPHKAEKPSEIPAQGNYREITRQSREITRPNPPDSLNLIPDSLNLKEETPASSFCKDIQKFTCREPYKSIQFRTAEYRNAIAALNELIEKYGYDRVLSTARQIHEDDPTAYSIFQFAWMIPNRLKDEKPATKPRGPQWYDPYDLPAIFIACSSCDKEAVCVEVRPDWWECQGCFEGAKK